MSVAALVSAPLPAMAAAQGGNPHDGAELELLDSFTLSAGSTQLGTPFGGISGLDYRATSDSYAAISDDRSENAPARFYELKLELAGDAFAPDALHVTRVTTLRNTEGAPWARRTVDPESIRWDPSGGGILWTTEGSTTTGINPTLWRSDADGAIIGELPMPDAFAPQVSDGQVVKGARTNQSLESLAVSPDGSVVTTGVENALVQDGPAASLSAPSPSRIVTYDRSSGAERAEYVYSVDPVEHAPTAPMPAPINTYSADRGLSDLVALNATDYLAVERSFASGVGYSIKLYWTTTIGAQDVKGNDSLTGDEAMMPKHLIFDFATTGTNPDNVEGITWGPRLSNGDRSLILSVDDNFGFLGGATTFHLLRVPTGSLPINSLDINGDGRLSGQDLGRLKKVPGGDLDGDGDRDAADIHLWQRFSRLAEALAASGVVNLQPLSFDDFHGPRTPSSPTAATAPSPSRTA